MKIEHLAIVVSDLQRAKAFFCKYFGGMAATDYHNPRTGLYSCFILFAEGARLELMMWSNLQYESFRMQDKSLFHISFSVGSKEQVDVLTNQLVADGYQLKSDPRTTGDGYYESVIIPFDDIEVEITI